MEQEKNLTYSIRRKPRGYIMNRILWRFSLMVGLVLMLLFSSIDISAATNGQQTTSSNLSPEAVLSVMTGGNTVGGVIREKEARADGYRHIDTPAMIERLKALHVNTYTYGVWDSPTDWEDLRTEFAPAAQAAGINIRVYIVPPSECFPNPERHLDGRCSRPFKMDYVTWAQEIAKLSKDYPNVIGWAIDDFLIGANGELFTKDYLAEVRAAQDAINPDLKWFVTLYYGEINDANLGIIEDSLDGVIYPFVGYSNSTVDPTWLEARLDSLVPKVQQHDLKLELLVYAGRFLDAIVPPTEDYVADVMRQAEPYLADGRISGIVAYATPVELDQQPSYLYKARSGAGRLSFSISNFTSTSNGGYAEASQTIAVDPNAEKKTLSFYHFDQDDGGLLGYQYNQVLIDGDVVWEQDIDADPRHTWIHTKLDLTDELAGKTSAELTFRLFHKQGVGWWPIDVGIDDVSGSGITIQNGGFDTPDSWDLNGNDSGIQPLIDIYVADRPTRIFNAVGAAYAGFQGQNFSPVKSESFPNLRLSPQNRAMYGNGRLSFVIPEQTTIPGGTCASAWQDVTVEPDLARYELSFWHTDWNQAQQAGHGFKEILIDGELFWKRDLSDYWPWFYMNGSDHQGPIDVTDFVKGKEKVRLTLRVCVDNEVSNFGNDISFDNIETIGLNVRNPGFETLSNWHVDADAPLDAKMVVSRSLPQNSADMKALVEQFEEEGEFEGDGAAHALKVHLVAVDRFERQEAAEKVVKHMRGFKLLLDHQKDNAMISKEAYDILQAGADYIIKKWQ